jgi:hypothetical protein
LKARLDLAPVTLDQADLPEYALPTTIHIVAANRSSLGFKESGSALPA